MARKQICETAHAAVADIRDGATLLVHSCGPPQAWPTDCLLVIAERGAKGLTVITNSPSAGPTSLNILAEKQQIRKLISTFVGAPGVPTSISEQVRAGVIESELVPQGT
jgi:acyl CoA:acetate/3-ketoacid CoA transferase alpha subunit